MVSFSDNLYSTESVSGKIGSIKWKTFCGIGMTGVHFITLAENGKDLFDIYSAVNFKQRNFRKSNLRIIGVAGSYKDACGLVKTMINEALSNSNDLSKIRDYFDTAC